MTTIEATGYIGQLSALRRFPKGDAAQKALIKQFSRHADDAAHAERMVAAIIDQHSDWPGPAAIREAAKSTLEHVDYAHSSAGSQMQQWREEYEQNIEPWLCQECRGFGVVGIEDEHRRVTRYDVCGCPEGDPHWYDPATGKRCAPGVPGAVLINGDEWLAKLNRQASRGAVFPLYAVRRGTDPMKVEKHGSD